MNKKEQAIDHFPKLGIKLEKWTFAKKIENKLDLITQHNSIFFHRKIQISNFDSSGLTEHRRILIQST